MTTSNRIGRPPVSADYTQELGEEICLKLSTSDKGLQRLCKSYPHWPCHQTIYEWRIKIPSFGDMYRKAKRDQVELLVDQMLDISDDTTNDNIVNDNGKLVCNNEHVNRSRLRIDTRKWVAARLEPRIYGDRIQNETTLTLHEQAIKELKGFED
jgi:hypothetical protein